MRHKYVAALAGLIAAALLGVSASLTTDGDQRRASAGHADLSGETLATRGRW